MSKLMTIKQADDLKAAKKGKPCSFIGTVVAAPAPKAYQTEDGPSLCQEILFLDRTGYAKVTVYDRFVGKFNCGDQYEMRNVARSYDRSVCWFDLQFSSTKDTTARFIRGGVEMEPRFS